MWWINPVAEVAPPKALDSFAKVLSWIHVIPSGGDRKRIRYILIHRSTYNALLADGRWETKTLFGYPVGLVSDEFPEGLVMGEID